MSFFQQFFPDHCVSAFGTFQGGALNTLPVRNLCAAFCTNTIATHTETSSFVSAAASSQAKTFALTGSAVSSKIYHNNNFLIILQK
jgi:hypothetical protein